MGLIFALLDISYQLLPFLSRYIHFSFIAIVLITFSIFVLFKVGLFNKLGFSSADFNRNQIAIAFLILIACMIGVSILTKFLYVDVIDAENAKIISGLTQEKQKLKDILEKVALGASIKKELENLKTDVVAQTNCDSKWDYCSYFKDDSLLDNKDHYYQHTDNDKQILILGGDAPFNNPPLFFDQDINPFYTFELEVQPLNSQAADIIIESRSLFQLFIGDNDYRSLALLRWDNSINKYIREKDSKIYLGKDLNSSDIAPKTLLTIKVQMKKNNNNAELNVNLSYKDKKGNKSNAYFTKIIPVPADDPEKFLTRVGTGMYRPVGDLQQAKFYFMGLKKN